MLTATLILLPLAVAACLACRRHLRRRALAHPAPKAEYLPTPHAFITPALEVAAVAHAGGRAAVGSGRPGHRTVEEVRRRCHFDFAGAMNFLEGQLDRRVSDDAAEQSRYWADLAEGLRGLNLHESLPALLRRTDEALAMPHGERYAAEVAAFAAFAEYLHEPLTPLGQAALKILRSAMEGVRCGRVPAAAYADAAFGDAVRRLSENCPNSVNPRLVLVAIEALRHARRSFHTHAAFRDDPMRRQTVRWQQAFLKDAEPVLREYLHDIAPDLVRLLEATTGPARREVLWGLEELHADTDDAALTLLGDPGFADRPAALECLRWSSSPLAATALCGIARHALGGERSAKWLRRFGVGRPAAPIEESLAALHALRNHPSEEAERVLLAHVTQPEAARRQAAFGGLGWWEPKRRAEVIHAIRAGKADPHPEVRRAALAAAARLGEVAALQMIREMLVRDNPASAIDAVRLCADEGLTWLWPDLDVLTESDDPTIAAEAWEAVERLRETFLGPLG